MLPQLAYDGGGDYYDDYYGDDDDGDGGGGAAVVADGDVELSHYLRHYIQSSVELHLTKHPNLSSPF